MDRRIFLGSCGALALSACATPPAGVYEVREVPAPQWQTGDTWTFRRVDGYNGLPRGLLTRTVTASDERGIRFVTRDQAGRLLDDALFGPPGSEQYGTLSEEGPVTGRFTPALRIYDFPLAAGMQWQQALHRTDANGFRTYMSVSIRAEGWDDIRAADEVHHALILRRSFNLGPKDSFTGDLFREEVEWYAPALRGPVHLRTSEWYFERRLQAFGPTVPGNRFVYELLSHRLA